MKFGCCLNMVSRETDGTGKEWIGAAAEAGFDYVELPLAEMMDLSEEETEELKKSLEIAKIPCEACNNFFPKTIRLTGENVNMQEVMHYVKAALSRAEYLGAKRVVFGSGPAKNVPEGFPKERGYQQVTELLKQAARVAEKKGITIVIEPLRKQECNLINTFEEGVQLAKDVDEDAVKVLVDFYHLTEENETVEHLAQYGADYLRHIHFARPKGRVYPKSMKEENYRPFIDAVRAAGYDARVSCEAYSENFEKDAKEAVAFFHDNFGNQEKL